MNKEIKALYLSYDGMTDALGESQVLSYLVGLAQKNVNITLISFEKKEAYHQKKERIEALCKQHKINWVPLTYTASPPVFSTLYDVLQLKKAIKNLNQEFDLVHCRGYITSIVGRQLKLEKNTPFIFDMRGFWADEKLESGNWAGVLFRPIYNYFKKKEQQFFDDANYIVSLTEVGKKEINTKHNIANKKIKTIPTCVNQDLFDISDKQKQQEIKQSLNILPEEKVMVYSGSLGGNYNITILIEAFTAFLTVYPNAKLLILSKTKEDDLPVITPAIKERIILKSLPYHQVGAYLSIADLGFVFYKKGYSTIGRYPTKLGEYWSCGVPSLVYHKIGDTQALIDQHPKFGLYYFDQKELAYKLPAFDLAINKTAIRAVAKESFSLEKGINFYFSLYEQLVNEK